MLNVPLLLSSNKLCSVRIKPIKYSFVLEKYKILKKKSVKCLCLLSRKKWLIFSTRDFSIYRRMIKDLCRCKQKIERKNELKETANIADCLMSMQCKRFPDSSPADRQREVALKNTAMYVI